MFTCYRLRDKVLAEMKQLMLVGEADLPRKQKFEKELKEGK